jgi:hypothetical protein
MVTRLYRPLAILLIPILIAWGLVGCSSFPETGSTASATPLPPCNTAPNNFYREPKNMPFMIEMTGNSSLDSDGTSRRETDAVSLLIHETKKWSVIYDTQQNNVIYRFTVTLISPELMLAVILANNAYSGQDNSTVATQLEYWMSGMFNINKQVLFLMTITSSANQMDPSDQKIVSMPVRDMALKTMSGLSTNGPQGEGMFDFDIYLSKGPVQYFFYFPHSVINASYMCLPLFDPTRDLSFTLGIKTVKINDKDIPDMVWNFDLTNPYDLVNINNSGAEKIAENEFVDKNILTTFQTLPECNMPIPSTISTASNGTVNTEDMVYWTNFSLCVWDHLQTGGH